MKTNSEFDKDCESICFECASSDNLTVVHSGVALCIRCFLEEYTTCVTCKKPVLLEDITEYKQCLECDYNNPIED